MDGITFECRKLKNNKIYKELEIIPDFNNLSTRLFAFVRFDRLKELEIKG